MAKIFVAFYNGMIDTGGGCPWKVPIFFESFLSGLKNAGNDLYIEQHGLFGADFPIIPYEKRAKLEEFQPDLCILFNNSYYDITNVVECPILIFEADSPLYYSNKDVIRTSLDRYYFMVATTSGINVIKELFGASENQIFYIPLYTEVHSDPVIEQETNISFIGTKFGVNPKVFPNHVFEVLNKNEEEKFILCVEEIKKNPFIQRENLKNKYNIESEHFDNVLKIPDLVSLLSCEKRIHVLSSIADLGLALFGTNSWRKDYYFDSRLNFLYNEKEVYTLEQNQFIYNTSKIGINISHLQAVNGFPWRVMDIMASNACLVTDYHLDFDTVFEGIKLPVYIEDYDARDLCKKLLKCENMRKEMVLSCQELIDSKYRFKHFLARLEDCLRMELHSDDMI